MRGWVCVNPCEVALGAPSAAEVLLAMCGAVPFLQEMNGGSLQCFACSGRHSIAAVLHSRWQPCSHRSHPHLSTKMQ